MNNFRESANDARVLAVVCLTGNVQGVGFRPFLVRLASQHGLAGRVRNTRVGVELEVEGSRPAIETFLASILQEHPPLAKVSTLEGCFRDPVGYCDFQIESSSNVGDATGHIPPDFGVCEDCRREFFDSSNRRFLHPFISCTNCGPRYTIIHGLPYDRQRTSMAKFEMCAACLQEYDDSDCWRFHCQTISCWDCGPSLWLQRNQRGSHQDSRAPEIAETLGAFRYASHNRKSQLDAIEHAVGMLRQGAILAMKGIGGFHLACDASNAQAVETLRKRKRRERKPFAIMVPDLEAARQLCQVDHAASVSLNSSARPICLLRRNKASSDGKGSAGKIAAAVAPGGRWLGLMLPYAPLHYCLLFDEFQQARFPALVMTSGNAADEPIAMTNAEALETLESIADAYLLHDRDVLIRADDSILRGGAAAPSDPLLTDSIIASKIPIRISRGYAPWPIQLKRNVGEMLAVGGHLKNSLAVSRGNQVWLSQHVGDLQNVEAMESLKQVAEHLQRVLGARPKVVAHDLHPDYLSTRYASQLEDIRLVGVQHHHAHVASCMAEHGLEGPLIGVVLDGTGLGADGNVWGGEILCADFRSCQRVAHLYEVAMPGNEQAIKQPWRMALSYLDAMYGDNLWDLSLPFVRNLDRSAVEIVLQAARQSLNSPTTSSCGRLFDAVSALCGICTVNTYEGQAAAELEMALQADGSDGNANESIALPHHGNVSLRVQLPPIESEPFVIDQRPLVQEVINGVQAQLCRAEISRRFHHGLTKLIATAVQRVANETGLRNVVLTGGCLQNAYLRKCLTSSIEEAAKNQGLTVWNHDCVPPNDGGLALGQLMIAEQAAP